MSSTLQTPGRSDLPFRGIYNDSEAFLPLDPKLREIRCVVLLPGSGDDLIECELVYSNINEQSDTRVKYVALSYCWGDLEDTAEILLHKPSSTDSSGERQGKTSVPFRVTRNLYIALQALREGTGKHFWIDALCINQQDPREKTHQVHLMGKIYSSAESVLVWLGPDDKYSQFLSRAWTTHIQPLANDHGPADMLVFWNKMHENTNSIWTNMARDEDLSQLGFEINDQKFDNSSPDRCGKAIRVGLDSLKTRPWWSRIWVLQEALLAPREKKFGRKVEFRVGNTKLRWFDILLPKLSADRHMTLASFDVKSTVNHEHIWGTWNTLMNKYGYNSSKKIYFLLSVTRNFQASDPRDKLFALLLLASDTKDCLWKEPLISPDYTKPTQDVLDDLIRWNPDLKHMFITDKQAAAHPVLIHWG